ncbi:dehalogenase [Dehalococcoides mccartyi]|jgi:hypothetical protein|uniref:Reductive dehalogenase anchoring protein n=3 Tax=Dehalococcoides TaxID=61434 RepID=A0A142VBQ0_9CHLR|nr:hypothetical protein [Dehalococcoides mccartyi]AGG08510.1 putative reductive dehalogenase anchoring protein [Dehalococcoides mccartyi BTF08]AII58487.1 dehalogenase [Dehalococcoides mccartyi CG1]AMU87244.1 reductive dehalogenase anchoring protein [Dehalococcoides mccartyi]APH13096.1 dehalogenase [Dehalococcoides mccartyi]AQX75183.1 reductive dehalogenase membrane anchor [Dehalococcoides mccartyi]
MLYWIGLVIGIAIAVGAYRLNRNTKLKWYDWLFGLAIIVSLAAGVQHYNGSVSGFENSAAWKGLALFGGLAAVLALVDWQLIARRKKA